MAVIGGCEQKFGVRRERQRPDGHSVALERVQPPLRLDVEDVDDAVDGATGQVLAVRTLWQADGGMNVRGAPGKRARSVATARITDTDCVRPKLSFYRIDVSSMVKSIAIRLATACQHCHMRT